MRILIAKFGPYDQATFLESTHPEIAAVRNITLQNLQHAFMLIGIGGKKYERLNVGNIRLCNLAAYSKAQRIFSMFLQPLLAIAFRPSVIVGLGSRNLIALWISCLLVRAKLIVAVTGSVDKQSVGKGFFFMKMTFRASKTVLAASEKERSRLLSLYGVNPKKALTYKYRVLDVFNPRISLGLKRQLDPDSPLVLTVGRMSSQKGLHYLVKASSDVIRKVPNVKFMIIAHSENKEASLYEKRILSMIEDLNLTRNFEVVKEFVPHQEMPRYFAAADLFVLPTLTEGQPMVLLEALACGVPVVSTNVGGIPEVIVPGVNGLLCEPRDSKRLSEAMISVLTNHQFRRQLKKGAIESWQRMSACAEDEFQNLLTKSIFT